MGAHWELVGSLLRAPKIIQNKRKLLGKTLRVKSFLTALGLKCFNPISHEYGPLWPIQVKSVHHFHRFWTFDTKIHDFVSFDVCQVPVKPFLTFFQKYLKNLALKDFGGPRACGEKLKKIFFLQYIEENVDFVD